MSRGSSSSLNRVGSLEQSVYWTDDLPVCQLSGVGSSTNQIYREDGVRREQHEFEDRSFHFKVDEVYLYGVFDGHDGSKVSNFAMQRMPAELLLGQIQGKHHDQEIKDVLRQAFISVEKGYLDSIDDALAEKYNIQMDMPEGLDQYQTYCQYPELFSRLQSIESELRGGTTATVALITNNRLYVANCGCCRALLCRKDAGGALRVSQLTVDHDVNNTAELRRLAGLGLDTDQLTQLGGHPYTRTIGDYCVKGGRAAYEELSSAASDPVIADPEVEGGIELDGGCCFLALMSDGLYKSMEESTGTEHVNRDIASLLVAEFAQQSTLSGVAQAVVDKVARKHNDVYMTSTDHRRQLCQRRDDIMLVVRNFGYPLPHAIASPTANFNPALSSPLSLIIPSPAGSPATPPPVLATRPRVEFTTGDDAQNTDTQNTDTQNDTQNTCTDTQSTSYTSSNDSGDGGHHFVQRTNVTVNALPLDEDGRVEAYVDFSDFYRAIEELSESQRASFHAETEPRPAYEPIPEEAGTPTDNPPSPAGPTT